MPFLFTGNGTRRYSDYVDLGTDKMLVAEPGEQYEIRVNDPRLPVPPADGFWEVAELSAGAVAVEPSKSGEDAPEG